jgi:sugar transferase (PEP-CTERM/EpsH1 system associated)
VRILFLAHRVPHPPNRGDKITTANLVRHFVRSHEVTVAALADGRRDLAYAEELRRLGAARVLVEPLRPLRAKIAALLALGGGGPFTIPYFRSRRLAAAVAALPDPDLVYVYSSSMAPYATPRAARVMHFGELDSDKWDQYARRARGPARAVFAREARTLLAFEREVARAFEVSVVCTEAERALFRERIPEVDPVVVPNGVDLRRFAPGPPAARDPNRIVFTGVMDYPPNVEAVRRFAHEVLPLVRLDCPDARFEIVGARPSAAVRELHDGESVFVVGEVADTASYLRKAAVAVAPLAIARGIQNKVLEAMACACPVVASPAAARGVDADAGVHLFVEEGAEATARRVAELVRDGALRARLGSRARARIEERYRWETVFDQVDGILAQALERRRARD